MLSGSAALSYALRIRTKLAKCLKTAFLRRFEFVQANLLDYRIAHSYSSSNADKSNFGNTPDSPNSLSGRYLATSDKT